MEIEIFKKNGLDGSSYQGVLPFEIHFKELVEILGPPTKLSEPGSRSKSDAEWTGKVEGLEFTLYNYKDGPAYQKDGSGSIDKVTSWNVGGYLGIAADKIATYLVLEMRRRNIPVYEKKSW